MGAGDRLRQRAETLSQYLKKGRRVYVEGRLEARPWTDQQGQIRAGLEVLANEVEFMSSRADDERGGGGGGGGDYGDSPRPASAPAVRQLAVPAPSRPAPRSSAPEPMDDGDLEDLPF